MSQERETESGGGGEREREKRKLQNTNSGYMNRYGTQNKETYISTTIKLVILCLGYYIPFLAL